MSANLKNLCGISLETKLPIKWIKEKVHSDEIPALVVGKRYLFNLEAVEAALARMAAESQQKKHEKPFLGGDGHG